MNLRSVATTITRAKRSRTAALILVVGLATMALGNAGRATADSGRGTANASIPFVATITYHGVPAPVANGRCPALTLNAQATAISTTFGPYTAVQSHCVDPNGPNPLAFTNGVFTWTNANGDTLFGSYSGIARPTPTSSTDGIYLVYGEYIVEGGTGAFAGATGGGMVIGAYDIPAGDAGLSLDGVLGLPDTAKP